MCGGDKLLVLKYHYWYWNGINKLGAKQCPEMRLFFFQTPFWWPRIMSVIGNEWHCLFSGSQLLKAVHDIIPNSFADLIQFNYLGKCKSERFECNLFRILSSFDVWMIYFILCCASSLVMSTACSTVHWHAVLNWVYKSSLWWVAELYSVPVDVVEQII